MDGCRLCRGALGRCTAGQIAYGAIHVVAQQGSARRIVLMLAATITAVVLLFGYKTSTGHSATTVISSPVPTSGSASGSRRYTGDPVGTRYGPVQVQITVVAGKVTRAQVVQVP